ncbi:glycosyltransferase family 1 protein [bacterium]|nr:glycosyltransferase family 1 protein [bacterium]
MTEQKPKYRIAQIVGNSVTGGVPSCILNYYRFFNRKDFQFDFYTYGPSRLDEEIARLGGNVYYTPAIVNLPKYMFALRKLLKDKNYHAIHSHLTSLSVFPLFLGWLLGIKRRYCHAHSTTCKSERLRNFVKNILKKFSSIFATATIACSKYSAKWMYGRKAGSAVIIRNAIDTYRFAPSKELKEEMRKAWGAEDIVIGHIGRFEYQKNHEFLIDVFQCIFMEKPKAKLILVGRGSLEADIIAKIDALGLQSNVIILPEIYEVEKYYNGFDILLLPSRYEGLPLVGVEAQAVNLPCIFSDAITFEADISGDNIFMPLDCPENWAKVALEQLKKTRALSNSRVQEMGYEIRDAAKKLEELYRNEL